MRPIILLIVLVVICILGVNAAHACNKIPKAVELGEQYTIHITLSSSFKVVILEIDNNDCWITGKYIKNNQKVFIDIDSIMAISEGAKMRR